MILIKITGGLGNQMFQYALACILAKKNNAPVYIDTSFFQNNSTGTPRELELELFDNNLNLATPEILAYFNSLTTRHKLKRNFGLNYPKIYQEETFDFRKKVLDLKSPVYLKGYFQSFKYFTGNENFIRKLFSFPIQELDKINISLLEAIKNQNSIGIHIRRGDYVEDKKTKNFHGNLKKEYYLEAISKANRSCGNPKLFFFSDDSEWVKKKFTDIKFTKTFIDYNTGENSWKDMFLMSNCKHNIIANSSFSWWGAWLNQNSEKTIIAPKKWFAINKENEDMPDLIPPSWIRIQGF